jgi:glycosyltransferase involved in cell wall biosynthesis
MLAERSRRRILYVTDGFAPFVLGGMQAFARRQLETIALAGYDLVSISSRCAEPPEGLPWRNIHLSWPKCSAVHRLNPFRYAAELERFSRDVAKVAERERPNLIYSEGPLVRSILRSRLRRSPVVFHPHGLEMFQYKGSVIDELKSWPLRWIVGEHARTADVTLTLSPNGVLTAILAELGVDFQRVRVLPNAAPEVSAAPRNAIADRSRFLFVGRDEPRKGLKLLIAAIEALPGAVLDVVGVDARQTLSERIRFHGEVRDSAALAQLYRSAHFLVVPSYAEGMPTVILEAFAAGLPVIASDAGANTSMVQEGRTGIIVPRGCGRSLTSALFRAMEIAPAEYARLSESCMADARERWSTTAAASLLLQLLDQLTGVTKVK